MKRILSIWDWNSGQFTYYVAGEVPFGDDPEPNYPIKDWSKIGSPVEHFLTELPQYAKKVGTGQRPIGEASVNKNGITKEKIRKVSRLALGTLFGLRVLNGLMGAFFK